MVPGIWSTIVIFFMFFVFVVLAVSKWVQLYKANAVPFAECIENQ